VTIEHAIRNPIFRQLLQITLLPTSENGIMARSPMYRSHSRNKIKVTPDPQNNPIIVLLSQRYVVPPQFSARRSWLAEAAKIAKPSRSRWGSVARRGWDFISGVRWSGVGTRIRAGAIIAAQGRLM
jgi:hypothetical protein